MRVLHFSGSDRYGGANEITYSIHRSCSAFGFKSALAVGTKQTADQDVTPVPNREARRSGFPRKLLLDASAKLGESRSCTWLARNAGRGLRFAAEPFRYIHLAVGHEDFEQPGTWSIADRIDDLADVVHCHNLHGGYFDLRALGYLSNRVPVIVTLHDAWLLTGGCGFSFDCQRWLTGCGRCPQLFRISRTGIDGTSYNWHRKRRVFSKSSLQVATPSRWLMSMAEKSILAPAMVERKVIPNGVDLSVFCPGDKLNARRSLDIPADAIVLLAVGVFMKCNHMKDFATLREAFFFAADRLLGKRCLLLVLGDEGSPEYSSTGEIRYIPYVSDPRRVASYYHASDLLLHAANVEVWGLAITQALACGVPVVATAVGGIPEQVSSALDCSAVHIRASDGATGVLVPPHAPADMGDATVALLNDPGQRQALSVNAIQRARIEFDLRDQVRTYCEWYQSLTSDSGRPGTITQLPG